MTADLPPIQPCADLPAVRALLAAAGLPVADLTAARLDGFWGCGESPDLTGVVGLEIYGTVALLRSLAVAPAWRGRGLGAALLAHAERAARRRGLAALYLLTTTAEAFFSRRGYVRLPRAAAPSVLRQTTEFAALCPASAVCLTRTLTAAADRTTRN
jgi:amino-acid N-acetyltransferase